MDTQRRDVFLENLKSKQAKLEMIKHYPFKLILKAITAWPFVFTRWNPEENEWETYHVSQAGKTDEETKILWLWESTVFNQEKAFLQIGGSFGDLISRLAAAYAIYPDGSYNVEFCNFLNHLLSKESRHG